MRYRLLVWDVVRRSTIMSVVTHAPEHLWPLGDDVTLMEKQRGDWGASPFCFYLVVDRSGL